MILLSFSLTGVAMADNDSYTPINPKIDQFIEAQTFLGVAGMFTVLTNFLPLSTPVNKLIMRNIADSVATTNPHIVKN